MTRCAWLALAAALAVTGCGRTGGPVPLAPPAPAATIRTVELAPTSTGAILSVLAVAPTQGYWNAGLVAQPDHLPGRRAFTFAAMPPPGPAPVLNERSREITAATYLSRRDLSGTREIIVEGADGARTLSF